MGGRDYLNLDNLAMLRFVSPYTKYSITLIFDPAVNGAPDQNNKRFQIEGARIYTGYNGSYMFDMHDYKRREFSVNGRTFIVTLLEINILPANAPTPWEYMFGITEK